MKTQNLLPVIALISACSSVPHNVDDKCAFYDTATPSWVGDLVYEHGYGATGSDAEDSAKSALAKRIVTDISYRLDTRDGEMVRKNMTITSDVRFSNITIHTYENKGAPGCWVSWAAVSPSEADMLLARRWARDAYESLDWLKVKRSDNTEDVVSFMNQYPGGIQYRDAEVRLDELRRKENKEIIRVSIWFGILAAMSLL